MDYGEAIARSLNYIERHITEELDAQTIAAQAGYSVYHFARVFAICRGMPLMDYVRARRLTLARAELTRGRGVLDVAVEYGFETASGFTRAFKREFGICPSTARESVVQNEPGKGARKMEVRLEKRAAFKVAGYGIETDVTSGYTRDVAAWWDKYEGENIEMRLYAQLEPPRHGEVGICIPCGHNGRAEYVLGVIVENYSRVLPDMRTTEVPAAEYAVFTTNPAADNEAALAAEMRRAWRYAFESWFSESGYVYDQSALDFEFYDERCHISAGAVAEVWIPIRRAQ